MARPKAFDPEVVLDGAVEVFWRQGFEATSIADLVSELGISRQSLYATYGSKDGLYQLALDRYRRREADRLLELLAADGPLAPRLQALLHGMVDEMVSDGDCKGCFVVNAATERVPAEEATRRQVADQFARLEEAFQFAFRRAQLNGELTAEADPRSVARFLLAALHGLRVIGKATPEPGLLADIAATTLARLPFADPELNH